MPKMNINVSSKFAKSLEQFARRRSLELGREVKVDEVVRSALFMQYGIDPDFNFEKDPTNWTKEQENYLKVNYRRSTPGLCERFAQRLGRTSQSIQKKAERLGLTS